MWTPALHPTYVCAEWDAFVEFHQSSEKLIKGLRNQPIASYSKGTIALISCIGDHNVDIQLHDVLYVPEARENLLSLGRLDSKGAKIICGNGELNVWDINSKQILHAKKKANLYYLDIKTQTQAERSYLAVRLKTGYTWVEWHCRLGHIETTQQSELMPQVIH